MTVVTAMLVFAAQQPPQQVTLADAVRRALEVQPAVVQARGDVRNASAGERAAWGAFLPTVTSSSSAARSNVGRIDQTTGRAVPPEYTYTVGLNASLDLFNGFHREANQRAAAADRKSTRLNSSHLVISYAVFCLKKKKKETLY